MTYTVKDSGERADFDSGMVRDTQDGKTNFLHLLLHFEPMGTRYAEHMTKANEKYEDVEPGVPNWTLAAGKAELLRFRESAARHFKQWLRGENDEDHAAAVLFNVNGAEYVKERIESEDARMEAWDAYLAGEVYNHDPDKYEDLAESMLDEDSYSNPVNPEAEYQPGDIVRLKDRAIRLSSNGDAIGDDPNYFPEFVTLKRPVIHHNEVPGPPAWYVEEDHGYVHEYQVGQVVDSTHKDARPADHGDLFQYDEAQIT